VTIRFARFLKSASFRCSCDCRAPRRPQARGGSVCGNALCGLSLLCLVEERDQRRRCSKPCTVILRTSQDAHQPLVSVSLQGIEYLTEEVMFTPVSPLTVTLDYSPFIIRLKRKDIQSKEGRFLSRQPRIFSQKLQGQSFRLVSLPPCLPAPCPPETDTNLTCESDGLA
jgi:hypothetical protein